MSLKLSLLAHNAEALARLQRYLPSGVNLDDVVARVGVANDLPVELTQRRPDLLVFDMGNSGEDDVMALERALALAPQTSVVLLSPDKRPEFLLRAMRMGVREVVPTPLIDGELGGALARHFERFSVQKFASVKAPVITFVPAKGGSGATFLAANLGYALSLRNKRVLLIDCNLHFGDAALFVTETPGHVTIADLARDSERLDRSLFEASLTRVSDQFFVLPSPSSPESAIDIQPEAIDRIFLLAQSMFDFVIVDSSRVLNAAAIRAIDHSDVLYMVLQLTIPFLHDGKRLLALLSGLDVPREKIRLIVNRVEKGSEIGPAQIEKALGKTTMVEIPNSFRAVASSINHGIPILKSSPRDAVARAIEELAETHCPREKERSGWLRGLLN